MIQNIPIIHVYMSDSECVEQEINLVVSLPGKTCVACLLLFF